MLEVEIEKRKDVEVRLKILEIEKNVIISRSNLPIIPIEELSEQIKKILRENYSIPKES